jgi:hypothetical protein
MEQSRKPLNPRIIKLIADSFGVNEAWLETGQGEMFSAKQDQELAEIIDLFGKLHPRLKKLVIEQLEVLLDMSAEARKDARHPFPETPQNPSDVQTDPGT